jgi:hypothetical protein
MKSMRMSSLQMGGKKRKRGSLSEDVSTELEQLLGKRQLTSLQLASETSA